jgi:hypothetical protein
MEQPKTPQKDANKLSNFRHHLHKFTPGSASLPKSVLLDRNVVSRERSSTFSAERLKLGKQRVAKEEASKQLVIRSRQVTSSRSFGKTLTPKQTIKATLKPQKIDRSTPCLTAPKKRNVEEFMQTSLKYGDKIVKIMESSSISPKKPDRPSLSRPDLEKFNLTDAMKQAKANDSRSVYMQVRELHKQLIRRRKSSCGLDSGDCTERSIPCIVSSSCLPTERSVEETAKIKPGPASNRLSRRMKTSFR